MELNPSYARGYAGLVFTFQRSVQLHFTSLDDETLIRVVEATRKAMYFDKSDHVARRMLGVAYLQAGYQEVGLAVSTKGSELNSNSPTPTT